MQLFRLLQMFSDSDRRAREGGEEGMDAGVSFCVSRGGGGLLFVGKQVG